MFENGIGIRATLLNTPIVDTKDNEMVPLQDMWGDPTVLFLYHKDIKRKI